MGGLIGEGVEVGFLVLQPFMVACSSRRYKENGARKKPAFYALGFQYLNPQQVISNIAVPSWSLLSDSEMLSYVCFIRAPWEEHFK